MTNCDNEKDSLLSFFIEKKFRHIIYMNYAQIKQLLKNDEKNDEKKDEKKEEVFDLYFYFQKCFFIFIEEFILNLSKERKCLTIKEAFRKANNIFNNSIQNLKINNKNENILQFLKSESEFNIICLKGDKNNDNDIYDFGYFNEDNSNTYLNKKNNITIEKDLYDEYDDVMKKNNIYFRNNPFKDNVQKEEKLEENNYTRYFKFPGIDYLRPENFKKLVEKRLYSMKTVLFDLIEIIRTNRFVNIYGDKLKFRGKVKICEEVCKYFYMNNYFKKGIFVLNVRHLNKVKYIPEIKTNKRNKDKKDNPDMLIVIEHVENLKEDFSNCWIK
jgi:hypothetical protein